jgi:hypothetical protein
MRKILPMTILLVLCCVLSQVCIGSENIQDLSVKIQVQLGKENPDNPILFWEAKGTATFIELASLTIIDLNTHTKKGQTKFFIRNINKGKVTKEDHTIDLGKHEPGEYEIWIENTNKKIKYSNKVTYTIN